MRIFVSGESNYGGGQHNFVYFFYIRIVIENAKLTRMEVNVELVLGLDSVLLVVDVE